jgi:hypothetical protein
MLQWSHPMEGLILTGRQGRGTLHVGGGSDGGDAPPKTFNTTKEKSRSKLWN